MARRPDIGYFDDGRDLLDPLTWSRTRTGGSAGLDRLVFESLEFCYLEDEAIWTRDWIGLGTLADLRKAGDILPFTAGNHGVHVQRLADGALAGRFNNAQHGGCRVVPIQCQQGAKTKCSFTSCGYSRDRRPMASGIPGESSRDMYQYTGLRPERLLAISLGTLGPVVFGNLDTAHPEFDGDDGLANWLAGCPAGWKTRARVEWVEFAANWKLYGEALFDLIDGQPMPQGGVLYAGGMAGRQMLRVVWHFPNVLFIGSAQASAAVVIQPTALGRAIARIEIFGPDVGEREAATAPLLAILCEAGAHAAALHARIGDPHAKGSARGWMREQLVDRVSSMPRVEPEIPLFQTERHYRI